jgi:hypothetical protein
MIHSPVYGQYYTFCKEIIKGVTSGKDIDDKSDKQEDRGNSESEIALECTIEKPETKIGISVSGIVLHIIRKLIPEIGFSFQFIIDGSNDKT